MKRYLLFLLCALLTFTSPVVSTLQASSTAPYSTASVESTFSVAPVKPVKPVSPKKDKKQSKKDKKDRTKKKAESSQIVATVLFILSLLAAAMLPIGIKNGTTWLWITSLVILAIVAVLAFVRGSSDDAVGSSFRRMGFPYLLILLGLAVFVGGLISTTLWLWILGAVVAAIGVALLIVGANR